MTFEKLIQYSVTLTLIEMMVAVGLGVTFREITAVATNARLLGRAVLANYILVPTATVALLVIYQAQPMVAVGFLILAVCPGAPFVPPCTAIARGQVSVAVGAMVILAGSSALIAPLLLRALLPLASGGQTIQVDSARIILALLLTQLIPLSVGLLIRHRWPSAASALQKPANRLSAFLNLATFLCILVVQFPSLRTIRLVGFGGMLILLCFCLGSGWLLGGPEAAGRKALALTTSLRNVGVGLVIATQAFPASPAVLAVVAYGIIEIIGSLLIALWWGRTSNANGQQQR